MANANIASGASSGAVSGMALGAQIGGPWGAAIGAVAGGVLGGVLGGKKKKYKEPARASGAVYGYDTYGNLVNKGTYEYNASTGKYELRAGELNSAEKAMRANLAGNIANLINTVGTSPEAFVRYAKELSDSYYKQGERHLAENTAIEQARLDESMARRGLSTSRAAADVQSELERRRQNTLADIYDQAQRYGYNVQSGLQSQANQAMDTLAGYQGQLMSQDQSYLQKALQAQQLGQAYENAKVGIQNQNIAMDNAAIGEMQGAFSQLGSMAAYNTGSQGKGLFGQSLTPTAVQGNYLPNQLSLGQNTTGMASSINNVGGSATGFLSNVYADPSYWARLGA